MLDVPKNCDIETVLERARYNTFVRNPSARKKLILFEVPVVIFLFSTLVFIGIQFSLHTESVIARSLFVGVGVGVGIFIFSILRSLFYFMLIRPEIENLISE